MSASVSGVLFVYWLSSDRVGSGQRWLHVGCVRLEGVMYEFAGIIASFDWLLNVKANMNCIGRSMRPKKFT